jgi:hypothetical protein
MTLFAVAARRREGATRDLRGSSGRRVAEAGPCDHAGPTESRHSAQGKIIEPVQRC